MKILITGGAGFVGSSLAVFLKMKYPEYKIMCLDNLKRRGGELNIFRLADCGAEFIHGDIRNSEDLKGIDFDILIDAAAEPSVLAGLNSSRKFLIDTNLNGTINAVEACMDNDAALLFLSSSRIYPIELINSLRYDQMPDRYVLKDEHVYIHESGFNEFMPVMGHKTLYGATKLSAEMIITEYNRMFGLKSIINRCGVIAGSWQFGKVDQGFISLWVMSYLYDKPLKIFGTGLQVRDILNAADLCRLVDIQIHNIETFSGNTFNVGGGIENSVSLLELDSMCKKLISNKDVEITGKDRELDIKYYVTDNSKINKLCGWKPEKSVETTVKEVINWINDNKEGLHWIFA